MEEKDKLTLHETEKLPKAKTTTLVLEKEEEQKEVEVEKSKVDLKTLRAELAKEREMKKEMAAKEQAITRPNYDMIQEISPEKRKKIYKVEKVESEEKPKPFAFNKKLKTILFAIVFIVAGAFMLTSGIELIDAANSLSSSQTTYYDIKLPGLIKKIDGIDNSNKALELIETYPDEIEEPSSISKNTNWFDRICNFISGLFGG